MSSYCHSVTFKGLDESHPMETEDETQMTAGVPEIIQPNSLEVSHLKLIDGVER